MKKLTTIIAAVTLLISTVAFAGTGKKGKKGESAPSNVSEEVHKAFNKKFSGAENVNWKQTDEFYFANFLLKEKNHFAAYNEKGELLGMARTLELSQLPMSVEMAIREQYQDYEINNSVTEMVLDGQTSYYATAEGKTRILQLKCYTDGQINVIERTKKKLVSRAF